MPAITIAALSAAKLDADHLAAVVTAGAETAVDRLGSEKLTLAGALLRMGYEPPESYTSGILIARGTQTVTYGGSAYAPDPAQLAPSFTTTNWASDAAKFLLVQGGRQSVIPGLATTVLSGFIATGLATGDKVFFTGRSVAEDGGGGMFTYSATSVQAADGVLVFAPTGGGRLFRAGWTVFGFNGRVNVRWAGAKGDGVTDDTACFDAAAALGPVEVPPTADGYVVNGIAVFDGLDVEGVAAGDERPLLIVATNDGCAFLQGSSNHFNLRLKNLRCMAAPGTTGARFFKQTNKAYYCAYPQFENVETYKSLACSYDGLFIFAHWKNCIDGYLGSGTVHQAISSIAATYGQANSTNINTCTNCQFFGAVGVAACVDLGYGTLWVFNTTDFEALDCPPIRARGVGKVVLNDCWAENIDAPEMFIADVYPATAAGSWFEITGGRYVCSGLTGPNFITIPSDLSYASFDAVEMQLVPAGMTLTADPGRIKQCDDVFATDGAGAEYPAFLAGVNSVHCIIGTGTRLVNGATDNGSGAKTQYKGVVSIDGGITSSYNVAIGASFLTIATAILTGGCAFINGYNTSGGAAGWWLVAWSNGGTPTVVASSNGTGLTVSFQTSGLALQMRTASGTLAVSTALLV